VARGALDRGRIVASCLELADAEGLASLSMRRISAELGVSALALYHHVAGKDELLDMIADESLRVLPEPDPDADPRSAVVDWATTFFRLLVDHPGLAQVLATRRLEGPVAAAIGARVLDALERAGVDDDRIVDLLVALVSLALGGSLYRTSRSAAAARSGERRMPEVGGPPARLRDRVAAADLSEEQFRSTVDRLLSGYLA